MKRVAQFVVVLCLPLLIADILSSTGCGGGAGSAPVAASQAPSAPTASLTATPNPVQSGQSVVLTWQTTNATAVTISGLSGNLPVNGSQPITPQVAATYILTAKGAGGTATAEVQVNLTTPPPLPTASISADPATVQPGQSATLTWQTTNARTVSISGIGAVATSGSQLVTPASTTTYTVTAIGAGGTAASATVVTVQSPAIPASFFGMTIGDDAAYPPATVPIGAIGHPTQLAWATIEPERGSYDFTFYDKFANWASSNGISFMVSFAWTPSWAVSNANQSTCTGNICTAPPQNIQDWIDFVTMVVNHYNGVNAPNVLYYEAWNEADSAIFWTGTQASLVALAQAAYPIIHQNPGSLLLAPSLTGPFANASAWMTTYLQEGGNLYADGASFHGYLGPTGESPYPFPEDSDADGYLDIVTRTTSFRALFDQNGLAGKPMFDSEGSWGQDNITDPNQQVAWVSRWYLLQAGTGLVQSAYWFSWGDSNPGSPETSQWGLISDDAGITPTTAGIAYAQVYAWLVGASISPCVNEANVWTCAVTRPGGYQGLAVWYYSTDETGTTSYVPAAQFRQYRDLAGNINPVAGTITIGPQPVLLETGTP